MIHTHTISFLFFKNTVLAHVFNVYHENVMFYSDCNNLNHLHYVHWKFNDAAGKSLNGLHYFSVVSKVLPLHFDLSILT